MGFVRNKVYKLVFEDPQYDGLVVRARSMPIGDLRGLLTAVSGIDREAMTPEDTLMLLDEAAMQPFARALVDWNLEDEADGTVTPVPATLEGIKSCDPELILTIVMVWMDAVMSVSGPLARRSTGGEPFQEASIPMEIGSPSPESLLTPA
jgi:hypothetical protein